MISMAMSTPRSSSFSSIMIIILILLTSTGCISHVGAADTAGFPPEKSTKFRVYFHEYFEASGPNATSFLVAGLHSNSSVFGNVRVFDNPLTEVADPSSPLVGRCQGMSVRTSLTDRLAGLFMANFVFTSGAYNGSTLALMGGSEPPSAAERTIVGGSGRFRLARGYAIAKLLSFSSQSILAEFDFYVMH